MEIKNLFEMAKADKYTADGRAQIEDARKTYQIGEISQATGLQKTANGWVKPKQGAGAGVQKQEPAKNKTFTFTKAGHVYNVPASTPAEAVALLKSRGVKGFKESDAFDDSTPREKAASKEAPTEPKQGAGIPKANNQASAARKEAEARGLAGVEMKDLFLAKTYEGASVSIAQRGLEAQGFDLLEANDKVNVYERPEGGRITFKLEGNKIKSADYQTPAETAHEGRELPKPVPKQGVTAKQKMKREDEKYEAARKDATMRNEGSTKKTVAKNPKKELELWEKSAKRNAELSGENQVVYQDENGNCVIYAESDSAGEEKAEAHGYKKMSLVRPDGSQKSKSYRATDSAPLTGDTKIRVRK